MYTEYRLVLGEVYVQPEWRRAALHDPHSTTSMPWGAKHGGVLLVNIGRNSTVSVTIPSAMKFPKLARTSSD
jgi:hypothetical protein